MDVRALRLALLDLVGIVRAELPALGADDWERLDRMAAQRRLQPLLHARRGADAAMPAFIADSWRTAWRIAAIEALAQRAELIELVAVLRGAGFAPLALKGAWLARHAYPEPAMRPMFDLDLLVARDEALDAYAALKRAGCVQLDPGELPLETLLDYEKHLPPLRAPRGTVIELHHRLWEPDGRMDHATPREDRAGLLARAVIDADGIAYPGGEDMLAHLAIHAAYSHRFDCGPRVLADIDMLLRAAAIDWPRWWARAEDEGWREGARLLLELVARYCPNPALDFAADTGPPPVRR